MSGVSGRREPARRIASSVTRQASVGGGPGAGRVRRVMGDQGAEAASGGGDGPSGIIVAWHEMVTTVVPTSPGAYATTEFGPSGDYTIGTGRKVIVNRDGIYSATATCLVDIPADRGCALELLNDWTSTLGSTLMGPTTGSPKPITAAVAGVPLASGEDITAIPHIINATGGMFVENATDPLTVLVHRVELSIIRLGDRTEPTFGP